MIKSQQEIKEALQDVRAGSVVTTSMIDSSKKIPIRTSAVNVVNSADIGLTLSPKSDVPVTF